MCIRDRYRAAEHGQDAAEFEDAPEAVAVVRAVAVAEQRLDAVGDAHMDKRDEHIRLGDNPHRGDRLVAVSDQRVVEQHGRHAHERGVRAGGYANGQHAPRNALACADVYKRQP